MSNEEDLGLVALDAQLIGNRGFGKNKESRKYWWESNFFWNWEI